MLTSNIILNNNYHEWHSNRVIPVSTTPIKDIDHFNNIIPVLDQGQLGSCVANTVDSVLSWHFYRKLGIYIPFSRLFLYNFARMQDGIAVVNGVDTAGDEDGTTMEAVLQVAYDYGCLPESEWSYDEKNSAKVQPKVDSESHYLKKASQYKITAFKYVGLSPQEIYNRLVNSPLCAVFNLPDTMDAVTENGIITKSNNLTNSYHAMEIVGIKQIGNEKYLYIKNSWGKSWGDCGYCYLSFDMAFNKQTLVEAYYIKDVLYQDLGV